MKNRQQQFMTMTHKVVQSGATKGNDKSLPVTAPFLALATETVTVGHATNGLEGGKDGESERTGIVTNVSPRVAQRQRRVR